MKLQTLFLSLAFCLLIALPAMAEIHLSTEPGGLEAVAVAPGAIELFWTPGERGTEVTILRDGDSVATVDASNGRWRDTSLAPGRLYTYTIGNASVTEKAYDELPAEAYYDVVVVGGSASGVAAAAAAARLGSSVALIEDTNRLGGMASNGLGSTDMRKPISSNGFFEDFRERIVDYYQGNNVPFWKERPGLVYEPRVANAVFKSLLYEQPNISIFRGTRFVSPVLEGNRVLGVKAVRIATNKETTLHGKITIDATPQGDVAAAAGVKTRIGREARSKREPHAGVIYYDNATGELLPGSTGEADSRLQSYAYLVVVKNFGPDADVRIPQPSGYDPEEFRPSPTWEKSWAYLYGRLPNGKFEINQHPFGTDLPEVNYNYPNEGPDGRRGIDELYRNRALQYLYYIQTELGHRNIGLADDEYRAEGDWPSQLYDREGRRIEGLGMLDETDIATANEHRGKNSIGIGDYPMDSHAVRTVPISEATAKHRGEGEYWLAKQTPWYQIPPEILIPKNVRGLLVSTAVSSTHLAYGTLRMEPVRMSLGQAAGTLANRAIFYGREPQQVPLGEVQDKLLDQNVYLTRYNDVTRDTRHFQAIQWLGLARLVTTEDFRPEQPLTKSEAAVWLTQLSTAEGREQQTTEVSEEPITRAEFAQELLAVKQQTSGWTAGAVTTPHYSDLTPGSPEQLAAEALYNNHITASSWAAPAGVEQSPDMFYPNATITRADAAEAIYLAHRPFLIKD